MPRGLSSLEIRAVVARLERAQGAFFDKAYEIARGVLLLRFRLTGEGKVEVALGAGSFLIEPPETPETPEAPSSFAMGLRKRFAGTRLASVSQHGFDRIVTFRFEDHGKPAGSLVAELFGDGNLLLLDPDGRIVSLHRREEWATRKLAPGTPYEPPPPRLDPTNSSPDALGEALRASKRKLVAALAVEGALGPDLAEHLIARSEVDGSRKAAEVTPEEVRLLHRTLHATLDATELGAGWVRRTPEGAVAEVALLPPRKPEEWERADFAEAVTRLWTGPTVEKAVRETEDRFAAELARLETQRKVQDEAVGRLAVEAETANRLGELVWLHADTLEKLLAGLSAERERRDWREIRKAFTGRETATASGSVRLESIDEHSGHLTVLLPPGGAGGEPIPVELDFRLSVPENANRHYDAGKRAREKAKGAGEALAVTRERIADLRSRREKEVTQVRAEKTRVKAPTRHFWFEPYRWFYTSTGHLVVAGRDASTNDKVVKKYLDAGDRYVHADVHGAPSCIVKRGGDEAVPEEALREAAELAVAFSRAFGQFATADAYWVTPEQVSKSPETGEYLPKGAFMVRGERNWLRGVATRAACALVRLAKDGRPDPAGLHEKVMGGSPSACRRLGVRWVEVEAANVKRSLGVQEVVAWLGCREEEASQALPPSGFQVVEKGGTPPEAPA